MPLNSLNAADHARLELAQTLRAGGYEFTTVTPLTQARVNARPENREAKTLRDVFGWSRPFQREIVNEGLWDLMNRGVVLERQGSLWRSKLRLSSWSGLFFFHSAFPTDQSDAVFFGPDTHRFLRAIRQFCALTKTVRRAIDIGCGAGPGAILLAQSFPHAKVSGGDINHDALRLARLNAALNAVGNLQIIESDLFQGAAGEFDLIVANPPYLVDEEERAYRHGGGPLGAEFSLRIVETALERLAPGGSLLLYSGAAMVDGRDPFREGVAARLREAPVDWHYEEIDPDVFGEELEGGAYTQTERIAAVVLTVTRRV